VYRNGPIAWLVTVDMNGCDYALHLGTTKAANEYNTTTTIVCPVGKHITATLFTTMAEHLKPHSFCHFTITEKVGGYPGLVATDTKNGKVDINGTVENITGDKAPTEEPGLLCPAEMSNTVKIALDITLEGKDGAGKATDISLSD
jgi:hypothetical protein